MPRCVIVSQNYLELHCVLKLVRIDLVQIERVDIIPRSAFRGTVPLLGVWGIFGYYGWYVDLRRWQMVRIYSQELRNLIRVEYDGGRVVYFGAREYERLVAELRSRIGLK